jgi:hypothetical protein
VRNASAHTPCFANAHAQGSAGDTHDLQDVDESDADEQEQAAAMPAESGEWRQSDSFSWLTNVPPSAPTPSVAFIH